MTDEVARLREQLEDVRRSIGLARESNKGTTALAGLSELMLKYEIRLAEAEGRAAEVVEEQEEATVEQVIGQIVRAAMSLPSYMFDDLLEALERARECEDPESWEPDEDE